MITIGFLRLGRRNTNSLKLLFNDSSKLTITKRLISESAAPPLRRNQQKIAPVGWVLLILPATAFGLGCWQIQRKTWKENLIRELNEKTTAPPVPLPDNLDDLASMEYRSVKVCGKFVHDLELYMGPRSFVHPHGAESKSSLMTARDDNIGYHVITPFKLSGREETILVNRGWVPKKFMDPNTRQDGQIPVEIELVGVVRTNENRPQFSPESRGPVHLYRDLNKMCSLTGASPVFLDANYESTIPGGPVGGQTRISLRNEHLSYIITWFSLSAATSFMWYRQIVKRKPF